MIFRSGNAPGADYYLSLGISRIDKKRLEVITPFKEHRVTQKLANSTINLDDINLAEESEVIYQSKANKKIARLVDSFAAGKRDSGSKKSAFIIRDTIMVLGTASGIPPATAGLFYDDLDNPMTGGTGHTMKVCHANNIPYFDQSTWFNWIQ